MTDRSSKKIIPDSEAVARCSSDVFMISDLLNRIDISSEGSTDMQQSFVTELKALHSQLKHGGYSREHYWGTIETFIGKNTVSESKDETFVEIFEDGMACDLLQPDGRGWQKGKLKLCFEFIPEEPEAVEPSSNNLPTVERSPLDEIRNSIVIESN
jgi:hypothetical protein